MILIGLQNDEMKYANTRHNAGSIVLSHFVEQEGASFAFDKFTNSDKASTSLGNVYLPKTYMNLSGESVAKIVKNENAEGTDLFVFFDDVTMPVGEFKISSGMGASSHNGIKSIIDALGGDNNFKRVRIGVGKILEGGNILVPGPDKLSDFVLSNLNNLEIAQLKSLTEKIIKSL